MTVALQAYASGNGALSFSYVEERFDRIEGNFTKIATGDFITREAIEQYVKDNPQFKDYLIIQMGEYRTHDGIREVETWPESKGPRKRKHPVIIEEKVTITVPPIFQLCAPVFRIGDNQVRLYDTTYTYSVDEENIFWKRDGEYTEYNLTLITEDEGVVYEVKNLNTRAAVRWFLNNEKRVVSQYPQQDQTTSESVSQLQEAIQKLQRAGMTQEDIFKLTDFRGVE